MTLLFARLLFVALLVLVTWLTVTSHPEEFRAGFDLARWIAEALFGDAAEGDKVAHFASYLALGASAALARFDAGRGAIAVIGLALYGAALEGAQALGGERQPDLYDGLANALGASAGYFATVVVMQLARKRLAQ